MCSRGGGDVSVGLLTPVVFECSSGTEVRSTAIAASATDMKETNPYTVLPTLQMTTPQRRQPPTMSRAQGPIFPRVSRPLEYTVVSL